jgi:hypothetical protein
MRAHLTGADFMNARRLMVYGLSLAAALVLAGCPTDGGDDNGDDGNGSPSALAGTWSGSINCTTTQSLQGTPGSPRDTTETLTITFNENGRPTGVTVIGFSGAGNQVASLAAVGDTATLTETVGTSNVTTVATVRSATYTSTRATITLDLLYTAVTGAATSNGTGEQTIEAVVNGTLLNYEVRADYDVTLTNPDANLSFDTGEVVECSGTLAKQ